MTIEDKLQGYIGLDLLAPEEATEALIAAVLRRKGVDDPYKFMEKFDVGGGTKTRSIKGQDGVGMLVVAVSINSIEPKILDPVD